MTSTVPVLNDGELPTKVEDCEEDRFCCYSRWDHEDEEEEEVIVVPSRVYLFRGWGVEPELVVEEEEDSRTRADRETKAVGMALSMLRNYIVSEEGDIVHKGRELVDEDSTVEKDDVEDKDILKRLHDYNEERGQFQVKKLKESSVEATTNNNVDDDHLSQPMEITKSVGSNQPLAVM